MDKIDTILFDWGGVIADDPGDEFLGKLLTNIGASDSQVQEIFDSYIIRFMKGEISEVEYWNELRNNYGFTIHDSISDEFRQWQGLVKNDDVLNLVNEAKAKGHKVALLTNVIEPTYNVLLAAGYYNYFDSVIASCKIGLVKPETEIYTHSLGMLGSVAEKSLFIDDKQKNLVPAKKLGFQTILAQNPNQIIQDVRAYL